MPMLLRRAVVDGGCADEAAMNMLLEIPTGLHFTGVRIYAARIRKCLPSTVRFAEACAKTLMKLSYSVISFGKSRPFSESG